jgi:hypothetical protein
MVDKEKLLEEHRRLRNIEINQDLKGFLKEHFAREEAFFEKHKEKLGGDDELSPLGMVKAEHKLLLELLELGDLEGFKDLFRYHLFKEETQIFTLLDD